jgi:hypothetical protein
MPKSFINYSDEAILCKTRSVGAVVPPRKTLKGLFAAFFGREGTPPQPKNHRHLFQAPSLWFYPLID